MFICWRLSRGIVNYVCIDVSSTDLVFVTYVLVLSHFCYVSCVQLCFAGFIAWFFVINYRLSSEFCTYALEYTL